MQPNKLMLAFRRYLMQSQSKISFLVKEMNSLRKKNQEVLAENIELKSKLEEKIKQLKDLTKVDDIVLNNNLKDVTRPTLVMSGTNMYKIHAVATNINIKI
jgi:hypothetical protein